LAARRIALEVTPEAEQALARDGFDPAFGARPLKRVIQREVGDRLAVELLEGTVSDGDAVRVTVDADGAIALEH
jgi:ATP-dependent Clp protease ATP-binding subunit ClpB